MTSVVVNIHNRCSCDMKLADLHYQLEEWSIENGLDKNPNGVNIKKFLDDNNINKMCCVTHLQNRPYEYIVDISKNAKIDLSNLQNPVYERKYKFKVKELEI